MVTFGLIIAVLLILGALVLAAGMIAGVWLGVNAFPPPPDGPPPPGGGDDAPRR